MKEDRKTLQQSVLYIVALLLCSLALISAEADTMDGQPQSEPETPGELALSVSGASAGITTDYFEQTLAETIQKTGIFPAIYDTGTEDVTLSMIGADGAFPGVEEPVDAPYQLKVRIIRVDAPSFSIHMKVSMNAVWELYDRKEDRKVMQENIRSGYTGGAFEGGFSGASRVRAAVEGAIRENIRLGVAKLTTLDILRSE